MNDERNFAKAIACSVAYIALSLVIMFALILCVCFVSSVVR